MRTHKQSKPRRLKAPRRPNGNMIALIGAIAAGLLVAILLFSLSYTRLLGGSSEQKTAIEAAALAAAKDLGRIVIKDDHFGWVSLSDYAPTGPLTIAPDGYYQPVSSLNTILATIRLDMIMEKHVAAAVSNPASMQMWKDLAQADYDAASATRAKLVSVMQASMLPGGSPEAKDIQGNLVNPYQSAENAYKENSIRQTGGSAYVNGSLKLTLGCLQGGSETTVKAVTPETKAELGGNQLQNGKYLSYTNYSYNGKDFVFTAAGSQIKLIDSKNFKQTLGLPAEIPSIVMAEADQKFFDNGNSAKPARIVHTLACAQPACVQDPKPAPGMMVLDFPDGKVPTSIARLSDLLNQPELNGTKASPNPADFSSPKGGDYAGPGSTGSMNANDPWSPQQPANGNAAAMHDWVRRGGHRVNIDSVVAALTGGGTFTGGNMYRWMIDQSGNVVTNTKVTSKEPYIAVAENQVYMECTDALDEIDAKAASGKAAPWAFYMKDECRKWGQVAGGQHAGQPLPASGILAYNPTDTWVACLPTALPDNAIALNGDTGKAKLEDMGAMGVGANDKNGSMTLTATTALPIGDLNDWADLGTASLVFPFTATSPASGAMPPVYLQNGVAVMMRFRVEEITSLASPGKGKTLPNGLVEGHFKK